jgi:hypothetical protein
MLIHPVHPARSSRLRAAGRLERLAAQCTLHRLDALHRGGKSAAASRAGWLTGAGGRVAEELLAGQCSAVEDVRAGAVAFSQPHVQENTQVVPDGAERAWVRRAGGRPPLRPHIEPAVRPRKRHLNSQIQEHRTDLPRITLIETGYQRAITDTEVRWLTSVIGDLKSGRLAWERGQFAQAGDGCFEANGP